MSPERRGRTVGGSTTSGAADSICWQEMVDVGSPVFNRFSTIYFAGRAELEAAVAPSPPTLKGKINQLRRLIEQAEQSKREARSLHVSVEYYKGRISALHDAIE